MSNRTIDAIIAAGSNPKHCKCGHRKTTHSETITDQPCELTACGCKQFRGTSKVYIESDKDDLYDMLVSAANENAVWIDRLAAHEHCAENLRQAKVGYDRMHESHDAEIMRLRRDLAIAEITTESQKRKLVAYGQLIQMAVDGGRISSDLFDTIELGLGTMETFDRDEIVRLSTGGAARTFADVLAEMGDKLASMVDDDEEYVTPRDLQVKMSASSAAQRLKDEAAAAADDMFSEDDTSDAPFLKAPLPKRSRPVKDDPQA